MPIWGYDVSNHQGYEFDHSRAYDEDFRFCVLKSSEGDYYRDETFQTNLDGARAAGMHVAAYHFMNEHSSIDGQLDLIRDVVPIDVPLVPDVEPVPARGSYPGVDQTRALLDAVRDAGYTSPFVYLPHWYWAGHLGRPDISDLPPLWSSRYASTDGYASQIYQDVPEGYWDGYGGLSVSVLQFTSSANIAGRAEIDANAYRGSHDELASLFTAREEEDEMSVTSRALPNRTGSFNVVNVSVESKGASQVVDDHYLIISSSYGNTDYEVIIEGPSGVYHDPAWIREGYELADTIISGEQVSMLLPGGALSISLRYKNHTSNTVCSYATPQVRK